MMKHSIFGPEKDREFMEIALAQARKAAAIQEVPIGAVIVNSHGKIIARSYNHVEKNKSQSCHAEILAIAKAGKKLNDWRLEGCWLYVTLQPCAMCIGLVGLCRLKGLVYGAVSPLFGYRLDNSGHSRVYKKDALHIVAGVASQEAAELLQQFFKQKRKKGEFHKTRP